MALLIFLPYFRWWAWGSVKLSNFPKIRRSWWSQAFISKCSYSRMYAFNCYTIPIYLHYSEYLTSTYLAPGFMLSALCTPFTSRNSLWDTVRSLLLLCLYCIQMKRLWLMALSCLPKSSELEGSWDGVQPGCGPRAQVPHNFLILIQ